MLKNAIFFFLCLVINTSRAQDVYGLDKEEALKMFEYLQDLRQKKVPRSDKNLRYVGKNSAVLHWNDTLAKVAEARALDLATGNYFDHIDKKGNGVNFYIQEAGYYLEPEWTEDRSDNYFESLEAGKDDFYSIISDLIIDKGIPSKGHRKHLLGLDDWNKKNTDIGIALYRTGEEDSSEYSSYTVIIIARHYW